MHRGSVAPAQCRRGRRAQSRRTLRMDPCSCVGPERTAQQAICYYTKAKILRCQCYRVTTETKLTPAAAHAHLPSMPPGGYAENGCGCCAVWTLASNSNMLMDCEMETRVCCTLPALHHGPADAVRLLRLICYSPRCIFQTRHCSPMVAHKVRLSAAHVRWRICCSRALRVW